MVLKENILLKKKDKNGSNGMKQRNFEYKIESIYLVGIRYLTNIAHNKTASVYKNTWSFI